MSRLFLSRKIEDGNGRAGRADPHAKAALECLQGRGGGRGGVLQGKTTALSPAALDVNHAHSHHHMTTTACPSHVQRARERESEAGEEVRAD